MNENPYHLPPNIVDGMKLTRVLLGQLINYITGSTRDALAVTLRSYSYGLLPPAPDGHGRFSTFEVRPAGHQVRILVRHCEAITRNGVRISVTEEPLFHIPPECRPGA